MAQKDGHKDRYPVIELRPLELEAKNEIVLLLLLLLLFKFFIDVYIEADEDGIVRFLSGLTYRLQHDLIIDLGRVIWYHWLKKYGNG